MELTVDVPWGKVAAKTWGDPCSYPVLLVHGYQDNAGSFDRLIPKLPSTFYYVCLDLPGHGHSSRLPKGIHIDNMIYVNSVYRVIRQLKWSQFYFIGHSFGGRIAAYYAGMFPEQVVKLILLDSTAPNPINRNNYLAVFERSLERIIDLENKMTDKDPPSYTYEEALNKIITQRPFPITKEAAKGILERALKKTNKGYYFSTDQRLKWMALNPIEAPQYYQIISEIKSEVLLILSNRTHEAVTKGFLDSVSESNVFAKKEVDIKVFELYKSKNCFKMEIVQGDHDVHNNEPEKVCDIISDFMLTQHSAL